MVQALTLVEKYGLERYISKPRKIDFNVRRLDQLLGEDSFGVESLARGDLLLKKAQLMYPEISPDFLSVGSKQNKIKIRQSKLDWNVLHRQTFLTMSLPLFAIYSLENPVFGFSCELKYGGSFEYKLKEFLIHSETKISDFLNNLFFDQVIVCSKFQDYNMEPIEVRITSSFNGIIPPETKNEIQKSKKFFSDEIYIIAEADWKLSPVKPKPTSDPLVIGVLEDNCFLISQFNTTPMEEEIIKKMVKKK